MKNTLPAAFRFVLCRTTVPHSAQGHHPRAALSDKPKAQSKLLTCTRGALLDVAVDIRHGSPSYLKWIGVELTEENKKQIFIPKGCLHGFLTLTDDVEVEYKVDEYYAPENDRSIRFDDPALGVLWGLQHPILSAKDQNAPLLAESDVRFIYHCKALFQTECMRWSSVFAAPFSPIFGWVKLSFFE